MYLTEVYFIVNIDECEYVSRSTRSSTLHLHARVQVERLLHHFVRGKRNGHHRNSAQIVDGHAAIEAAENAVLHVDRAQRLDHAVAACVGGGRI